MKSIPATIILLSLSAWQVLQVSGDEAGRSGEVRSFPVSERPSVVALDQARGGKPFAGLAASVSRDRPVEKSFVERSDSISARKLVTFLPKNAILHVPEHLSTHVTGAPAGDASHWNDFYRQNRGLVQPFEVTLQEAAGTVKIDPDRLETAKRTGKILVAVIRGFPTSVNQNDVSKK